MLARIRTHHNDGALRNGVSFKDRQLPGAPDRIRTRPAGRDGEDRQFVRSPATVQQDGLAAVEATCAEALDFGASSANPVHTILARQHQPAPPSSISAPEGLQLRHRPVADSRRCDILRLARRLNSTRMGPRRSVHEVREMSRAGARNTR